MWTKWLCLLTMAFSLNLNAQIDSGFVEHLKKEHLTTEWKQYLSSLPASDTLEAYWTNFYMVNEDRFAFQQSAQNAKHILQTDSTQLLTYSLYALQPKTQLNDWWFHELLDSSSCTTSRLQTIRNTYFLAQFPIRQAKVPLQLEKDYRQLYKASLKKPIVAGSLSALVPGLGLCYLNKPRSAFTNFTFIGFLALQTIESVQKFGWKHPMTIVNSSFLGGFYLVNIFGSALEVKKNLNERKTQFLTHASTYYTDTYRVHFQ